MAGYWVASLVRKLYKNLTNENLRDDSTEAIASENVRTNQVPEHSLRFGLTNHFSSLRYLIRSIDNVVFHEKDPMQVFPMISEEYFHEELITTLELRPCIITGSEFSLDEMIEKDIQLSSTITLIKTESLQINKIQTFQVVLDYCLNVLKIDLLKLSISYYKNAENLQDEDLDSKMSWMRLGFEEAQLESNPKECFEIDGVVGYSCTLWYDMSHIPRLNTKNIRVWKFFFLRSSRRELDILSHSYSSMEVLTMISKNTDVYSTQGFSQLIEKIDLHVDNKYSNKFGIDDTDEYDGAIRIVADHLKAVTFGLFANLDVETNMKQVVNRLFFVAFLKLNIGHGVLATFIDDAIHCLMLQSNGIQESSILTKHQFTTLEMKFLDFDGLATLNTLCMGMKTNAADAAWQIVKAYGSYPMPATGIEDSETVEGSGKKPKKKLQATAQQEKQLRAHFKNVSKTLAVDSAMINKACSTLRLPPTIVKKWAAEFGYRVVR